MRRFRLVTGWASVLVVGLALHAAPAPSQWEQPAAALVEQIAAILGPGQATLTIRNLSSIAAPDVPTIRALIEQDCKIHGIVVANGESANAIRITLSRNERERLWVAEVVQGNETRVVMVEGDREHPDEFPEASRIVLRKERYVGGFDLDGRSTSFHDPVLAVVGNDKGLVLMRAQGASFFQESPGGWRIQKTVELGFHVPESRDPRGVLIPADEGEGFAAFLAGAECTGKYTSAVVPDANSSDGWSIHCHGSDEPWPILRNNDPNNPVTIKAFYNAARNYFTGVVAPSIGVDLPPFYSAALLSRPMGSAVLIGGIDGKVQLAENGTLKTISGVRDWGSDFAVLKSGCGSGTQVIASGSGEAASDSLRAYELPAQEAAPASAPLSVQGTVTALWAAPDGKSVFAVVRGPDDQYEVDRVTALCN